jgi:hypothetical protein
MAARPVEERSYCSGGNDSTVKRPTQENLPLVAFKIGIGRVVWMWSLLV